MSLLMQALKKAEQSKQQLTEKNQPASDLELGASPVAASIPNAIPNEIDNLSPDPLLRAQGSSTSSELSLSPPMEFSSEVAKSPQSADGMINVEHANIGSPTITPESESTTFSKENAALEPSLNMARPDMHVDVAVATNVMERAGEGIRTDVHTPPVNDVPQNDKKAGDSSNQERLRPDYLQVKDEAVKEAQLEQQKAKAVFSAKTKNASRAWRWLGIGALSLTIVIVGVAYVYLNMMNAKPSVLPSALPEAQTAVPAVEPEKVDVAPEASVTATNERPIKVGTSDSQSTPVNDVQTRQSQSRAEQQSEKFATKLTDKAVRSPSSESLSRRGDSRDGQDIKGRGRGASPATDAKNIQVVATSSAPQLHPDLNQAYQALAADDLNVADTHYRRVLKDEPHNRDALLGLAAVAARRGQIDSAVAYYLQLLELDPTDPDAIAGLAGLQQGDLTQAESRLKKALHQFPNASGVLFAMGNVYAQQARWSEAQQMYFRAFSSAPTNPDFAFNLAVSLDRLNQVKLAREYYQRALALTQTSAGNFNKQHVRKRVQALDLLVKE